jgi:protein SCO1/2
MHNKTLSRCPVRLLVCLCALLAISAGCNHGTSESEGAAAQSATKHYLLTGKVISIHKQAGMAIIDNDLIPGFMDAMMMPYIVRPASALDQLQPGDSITADVIIEYDRYWLENVKVTGHSTTTNGKPAATSDNPAPKGRL